MEAEWNDKASRAGLGLVGESEVVVDLYGFPAILARQVEGTLAVKVVGHIDACGSWRAHIQLAVVSVDLTVLALETYDNIENGKKKKN